MLASSLQPVRACGTRAHTSSRRPPICVAQATASANGVAPAAPASKKAAAPAAAGAPASNGGGFTNTQRFVVPGYVQEAFRAEWQRREQAMRRHAGFVGFSLVSDGDAWVVTQSWASIPDWESWSLSEDARRSHLPSHIYQYVPKKGEGFPEDFVPFKNYDEPVNAKY